LGVAISDNGSFMVLITTAEVLKAGTLGPDFKKFLRRNLQIFVMS
jgi:hypothetical protein